MINTKGLKTSFKSPLTSTFLFFLLFALPTTADVTSLTIIDVSTGTAGSPIVSGETYSRESLPSKMSLRADVDNPSDTASIQFINDDTDKVIKTERAAPYAIAGDDSGNYKEWDVPIGDINLEITQKLKNGENGKGLKLSFVVTAEGGETTPTPPSTPSPSADSGGSAIKFVWIDAESNKASTDIVDGSSFTRSSLPASLSIRADITPVSGSKNSVRFYVNGKFERQENVAPYAIAGDEGGGNYSPWTGLPTGDVELRADQVVSGEVVETVTIKFTVTDGTPTPTPSPSSGTSGTAVKISFASSSAIDDFATDENVTFTGSPAPKNSVTSGDITGTSLDAVYNSHKWSANFSFSIPVDGPKDVVLMFAETYSGACGDGKRVFTATVGTEVKNDIDVFKEVGCNAAYNVPFKDVTPNAEGAITVALVSSVQNAYIAGIQLLPPGSPPPTEGPSPTPVPSSEALWEKLTTNGDPTERHEACFVMGDDGKGYLVGGRGIKPVSVFDPKTNSWTDKTGPGVELHHMQCLVYKNKIWIGSSWTGSFPKEKNSPLMHIYDIATDTWSTREGLPEPRLRGGGAFVLHNKKMWLAMGNRGGHGAHATTLGWLDMYDPEANNGEGAWSTVNYPDAPDPRDHTSGGIVNGKLCIAGGRDGGSADFFNKPVLPVNCYNFDTGAWEVGPEISQGRAGAAAGTTCDGELMIAGGEGFGKAFPDVSLFDGTDWKEGPPLKQGRHGSGLAISSDCTCKKIYIASGSGAQGGRPELLTTEVYLDKGDSTPQCTA